MNVPGPAVEQPAEQAAGGDDAPRGGLFALEPRFLLDAAAAATASDALVDQAGEQIADQGGQGDAGDAEAIPEPAAVSDRVELVFIDSNAEGVAEFLADISADAEVQILDSEQDGVEQILAALEGRSDIDAVHVLADGTSEALRLGSTLSDAAALRNALGVGGAESVLAPDGRLVVTADADSQLAVADADTPLTADSGDGGELQSQSNAEVAVAFTQLDTVTPGFADADSAGTLNGIATTTSGTGSGGADGSGDVDVAALFDVAANALGVANIRVSVLSHGDLEAGSLSPVRLVYFQNQVAFTIDDGDGAGNAASSGQDQVRLLVEFLDSGNNPVELSTVVRLRDIDDLDTNSVPNPGRDLAPGAVITEHAAQVGILGTGGILNTSFSGEALTIQANANAEVANFDDTDTNAGEFSIVNRSSFILTINSENDDNSGYTIDFNSAFDSNSNFVVSNVNAITAVDNPASGYTEDGAPLTLDNDITLTDAGGDGQLASATLTITGGHETTDRLNFSDTANVTGSFDSASGTLTLTAVGGTSSAAQFESAIESVTFSTVSDNPSTAARTVTYAANHGTAASPIAGVTSTLTFNVAAANDNPTYNGAPASVSFTEDTIGDVDLSAAVFGDVEGDTLTVTLAASAGTFAAPVDGSGGGVTESINTANDTITLVGSAANINTYLDTASNLRYTPAQDANGTPAATITVTVNDGAGSGDLALDTIDINVTAVNDNPTYNGAPASVSFTEDTIGDVDLSAAVFGDVDGDTLTVTLAASAGTFAAPVDGSGGGVTESINTANDTVTLVGSAANINTYLDTASNLRYTPAQDANGTPAATITVTVNDGAGSGDLALDTIDVNVTAVNDDPAVATLPASVTVTEDQLSNVALGAAVFSDVEGDTLTVTLTASEGTFAAPADGSGGGVTASLNSGNVQLIGSAANINTYLDTASNIRYTTAQDDNGTPAATITVTANDGAGSGNVNLGTVNINVTPVNDNPTYNGAPASVSFTEDTIGDVDLSAAVFGDVEGDTLTVTLTASAGTFAAPVDGSGGGVTATLNGGNVRLIGSAANINTYLDTASNLRYTPAQDANGTPAATITVTVNDGAGSGNLALDTIDVNVTAVNDNPTYNGAPASVLFTEDTIGDVDLSAAVFGDVDGDTLTVTLAASAGTFAAPVDGSGGGVTESINTANDTITLVGSAANINTYLDTASNLRYTPAQDANGTPAATITVTVNDGAGSGDLALDTIDVNVTAVNDNPAVATLPASVTVTEDQLSDVALGAAVFSDVEGDTLTVTLTASEGTFAAPADGSGGGVTASLNSGNVQLIGSAANINTYLDTASNIRYTTAQDDNGTPAATITVTVNDGAGSGNVNLGTVNINVTPVNDNPTYNGAPASVSFTEDTIGDVDLSAAVFGDVEGDTLTVTLAASAGTFAAPVDGSAGGVTESINTANDTITLVGSAANINTYLDTASNLRYTPAQDANGTPAATITVTVNDGAGSGDLALDTIDVNVTAVNDDPAVATLPASVTVTEDQLSNVALGAAVFSDVEGDTLTVTLTASEGTFAAPADGSGGGVTASLNSGNVQLIGSAANINTYLDTASNIRYTTAQDDNGTPAATITVTANDGAGSGNVNLGTVNINVTPVNDNPTYNGAPASVSFTEDTIGDVDLSAAVFGDVEGDTLTVTLTASAGTFAAPVDGSGGGVTATLNGGNVRLIGSAANINTYLDTASNLRYTPAQDANGTPAATITVTVNDGAGSGDLALDTIDVNVTAVNDDPAVATLPASVTVTEDQLSNVALGAAVFSDVEGDTLTVTLTASEGTFAAPADGSGGGVTASLNSGNVQLIGSAANINTYLDTASNIRYTTAQDDNGTPAATITVTANDGAGSGNVNLGTVNVNVTPVNDNPTYNGAPASVSFTEDTIGDVDLSAAVFGDVDGDTLTVTLAASAGAFAAPVDGSAGGVTESINTANDTITLVGSAANINTYLDTASNLRYTPAQDANGTPAATITVTVNDGAGSGDLALDTIDINVTAVNDNPTYNGAPASVSFTEDTIGDVDLSAAVFGDVEGDTLTVTLAASAGTFAAPVDGSAGGVTESINTANDTVTLVGSAANINTYLDTASNLRYTPAQDANGTPAATITVTVNDGAGSGNLALDTIDVNVTAVNDAATITGAPTDLTVTQATASNLNLSNVAIADVDNAGDVTLTLTVDAGSFSAPVDTANVTETLVNPTTIRLVGTTAELTSYLDTASNLRYVSEPDAGGDNQATLSLVVNDGAVDSATVNVNLDVTAINDAPTVSNQPASIDFTEDTQGNFDLAGITFADADLDDLTVTLAVNSGTFGTVADGGANVTETRVNDTTVTLAGSAGNLNAYLATASNIQYTPATDLAGNGAATLTINANDGLVNPQLASIAINVAAVQDAPRIAGQPASVTVTEDTAGNLDLSGTTITEVDGENVTVTLTVNSGTFTSVADGAGNGVTESVNTANTTVTLQGTAAGITTYLATASNLQYQGAADANGNAAAELTIRGDDGVANVELARVDINITAVNDAPTIAGAPASVTVTEDANSAVDLSAITVADVDDTGDLTLTVVTNAGTFASAATAGGVTASIDNDTTVTLVGTATELTTYFDTTANIQYRTAQDATGNVAQLTLAVTDGDDASGNTQVQVNATAVNDAPTISGQPVNLTVTEDALSNLDLSSIAFADVDDTNLMITLSVDAGTFAAPPSSGGVTAVLTGPTSITLQGTVANLNTYLDTATNLRYTTAADANGTGVATLTISANDGDVNPQLATVRIDSNATDDAPRISGAPADVSVQEDVESSINLGAIAFEEVDGENLTVTIAVGAGTFTAPSSGAGVGAGVTASLNSGDVRLIGSAADINTYLDTFAIQYTSPQDANGDNFTQITINANDGVSNPQLAAINVDVNAVNDAPTIAGQPAAIAFTEDTQGNVNLNGTTFADVEGDTLTVTLDVSAGSFAVPASGAGVGAGVTATRVDSDTVTLTGAAGDINTYLQTASNVQYTPAADANGSATLTITGNDGTVSPQLATVTLNIAAVDDAARLQGAPTDITIDEDTQSALDLSSLTFTEVDGEALTVTLSVNTGAFSAPTSAGGVVANLASATSITLAGTANAINAYLDDTSRINYTAPLNANGDNVALLSINANDGNTNPLVGTINIDVNPVNDAPTVTGQPTDVLVTEDQASNLDLNGTTFADVEGSNLTVTLSVDAGTLGAPAAGAGVVVAQISATSVTISGSAASINAYLTDPSKLQYTTARDAAGQDQATLTISASDGTANVQLATVNIDVTPVDDGPALADAPASLNIQEDTQTGIDLSAATFSEPDGEALTVTLTVNNGTFAAPGAGAGVVANLVNATTVTLQGTAAAINTYLDTPANVLFTPPANVNGNGVATLIVNATDGVSGNVQLASIAINVAAVNDAPSVIGQPTDVVVVEDVASNVDLFGTIFADIDGDQLTVSLVASAGSFNQPAAAAGVAVAQPDSTTVTVTGSAGNIATYLSTAGNVQYVSAANAFGNDQATISVFANDGTVNPLLATINVDVTAVNDVPSVTGLPSAFSVTEDQATTLQFASTTFSEVDGEGLTVTLSVDQGAFSAPVSANGVTAVLTNASTVQLSGSAAAISAFVQGNNIAYTAPADASGNGVATLTVVADDAVQAATLGTVAINVTAVNDAPVFGGVPATLSVTEDVAGALDLSSLTFVDADGDTLTLTLTVNAGTFASVADGGAQVTATLVNPTTATLTGSAAALASYLADSAQIQYLSASNATGNGAASLTMVLSDGSVELAATATAINVAGVDDAPVLTGTGVNSTLVADGAPVSLFSTVSIDTVEPGQLVTELTVRVAGVSLPTGEFLNINGTQLSLEAGANRALGDLADSALTAELTVENEVTVVRLSHSGLTAAQAQALLEGISFEVQQAAIGDNANASRTLTITGIADNGSAAGANQNKTANLNVAAAVSLQLPAQPPSISVPAALNVAEDGALAVAGVAVSDVDNDLASTTLSVSNGILAATVGGEAVNAATLTITGSVAEVSAALAGLTYTPNANFNGTDTLSIGAIDAQGLSNTGSVNISVAAVNDAPVLAPVNLSVQEGAASVAIGFAAPTDVDGDSVTITVTTLPELGIVTRADGSAVAAGDQLSVADLQGLSFAAPAEVAADSQQSLLLSIDDGNGATITTTATFTLVAVNDAPVVVSGPDATFTENGNGVAVAGGLVVADIDNDTLNSAEVRIAGGFDSAADLLSFNAQNGITGAYDSSTGVLSLSGLGTIAQYQAALRDVEFSTAGDNPSVVDRSIEIQVSDGAASSAVAASTVTVVGVNDAPSVEAVLGTTSAVTVLDVVAGSGGLLDGATDPDSASLTLTQFDGATFSAGAAIETSNGALLVVNADGSFSYDPNGQFSTLAPGDSVTEQFVFTVADSDGGETSSTLEIVVTGAAAANDVQNLIDQGSTPAQDNQNSDSDAGDGDADLVLGDGDNNIIGDAANDASSLAGTATAASASADTIVLQTVNSASSLGNAEAASGTNTVLTNATGASPISSSVGQSTASTEVRQSLVGNTPAFDSQVTSGDAGVGGGTPDDASAPDPQLASDPGAVGSDVGADIRLTSIVQSDSNLVMVEAFGGPTDGPSEFTATLADGRALPDWISQSTDGVFLIDAPEGVESVTLRITAVDENGETVTKTVEVGTNGTLMEADDGTQDAAPVFSDAIEQAATDAGLVNADVIAAAPAPNAAAGAN